MLNFYSIKAELAEIKEKSKLAGGRYVQNEQLEELRNLQESLAKEKRAWILEKEEKEKEHENRRMELQKAQVCSLCQNKVAENSYDIFFRLKLSVAKRT